MSDTSTPASETAPSDDRPAESSLFVCPNGDAYRLRDYRVDLMAEPFTGEATVPSYTVHYARGMNSNTQTLPEDAVLVWSPNQSTPR